MICELQAVQWRIHPAGGESSVHKSGLTKPIANYDTPLASLCSRVQASL
ncbi:unnamed protein product [Chondrus crispus]|uniref:Uncharacterized protein n=1 Tax=Chondrus crispus TaxID=2769 RepID=R7QNZ7_CHOCR|nr:unnamed protein product [Chondrus crispus]CDF39478.1 unnamed protein product [Chondrus crispus]|eukprot:XP_005719389.1 unnamed protein product [Chondrus crispus]